jgi:hypothetical protein
MGTAKLYQSLIAIDFLLIAVGVTLLVTQDAAARGYSLGVGIVVVGTALLVPTILTYAIRR